MTIYDYLHFGVYPLFNIAQISILVLYNAYIYIHIQSVYQFSLDNCLNTFFNQANIIVSFAVLFLIGSY